MRILFLSPPQKEKMFPSLGPAYLVCILNQNNHKAFINDGADVSFNEMIKFVKKIKPEIVGITMNTTNRFECLNLAKKIKKKYNIPIILGGPHPTLVPDQLLRNYPFVDFIIRNEGEYSTLNLINSLGKKTNLEKIEGLSFRKNNKIIHNPPAPV